jgi:hypothetical protein
MINEQLIELAKISPKSYAKRILRRNQSLLKRLMLLQPYLHDLESIPDKVYRQVIATTSMGCPHCQKCNECLWNDERVNEQCDYFDYESCKDIMFDGLSLTDLRDQETIYVCYYDVEENIFVRETVDAIDVEEFLACLRFLEAHIEWAQLGCWGEKYKK